MTLGSRADAFEQLEVPIRDLERMASIAFEKAMAADNGGAADDAATFAATQLLQMARSLRQQYDQLAGGRLRSAAAAPRRLRVPKEAQLRNRSPPLDYSVRRLSHISP